jgi:hypothetical protein
MAGHQSLEETWGIAAAHAEHHIGDYIRYSIEGNIRSGTILWICAPEDSENPLRAVRYVVQPEEENEISPDLVWPGNILIDQAPQAEEQGSAAGELEQALLELLATLSFPVTVNREIDDSGQPFYVWYIGESTPQQPFGLHVGMDRHLIGALKGALETLIRHAQQRPVSQD